jgi:hypothetical protein
MKILYELITIKHLNYIIEDYINHPLNFTDELISKTSMIYDYLMDNDHDYYFTYYRYKISKISDFWSIISI